MKLRCLIVLSVCMLGSDLSADTLKKSLVDAEAQWLFHCDFDRARDSVLFDDFSSEKAAEEFEGLDEFRDKIGIDPLVDVHSLTLYSAGPTPEDAIVLVMLSNADKLREKFEAQDEHRTETHGGYRLHVASLDDAKEPAYASFMRIKGSERGLVLLAENAELAARGLDVIYGKRKNLAHAGAPHLTESPSAGSVFFVDAQEVDGMIPDDTLSAVAKEAKGVTIDAGEREGQAYADLRVRTAEPETAKRISQVLQGMVALASLATESEWGGQLRLLAESLTFKAESDRLIISFRYDAKSLRKDLGALKSR